MYNSYVVLNLPIPLSLRIEKAFLQIYISIILIVFAWTSLDMIRFPYGIDYGEAPLMDQARRLQSYETIYKSDFNTPPYVIANYPPLYPLLVATINSIFKIPLFQTGRLISFFFTLVSGSIIGLFAYHLTHKKILAALAGTIFLGHPYVMLWSSLARVDMMALALSLIGLFILFRKRDSIIWIAIACLFFIASVYTRQTYLLAAPLAGFIWLFHINRRRSILIFLFFSLLTLLIFGIINAITQGGFYLNIVVANVNPFQISRTFAMLRQLFVIWPVILLISVTAFVVILRNWTRSKRGTTQIKTDEFLLYGLGLYSFGALIIALTAGKVGSDVNYFLELISVCAIWAVIAIDQLRDSLKPKYILILGVIFIQFIWIFIASLPITRNAIESRWQGLSHYDAVYSRVNSSAQTGIVLSDDFLDMVVLSGQPIYYQPFEYGQLYSAGLWDPAYLTEQVNNKEFPLIIIGGDTLNKECCWPEPVSEAIKKNYSIDMQSGMLVITPKK